MSDPIFFPQWWGCFAFCAHIPRVDRYLQAVFRFQLLAVVAWHLVSKCLFDLKSCDPACTSSTLTKSKLLVFVLQVINRDSSPLKTSLKKPCFPTNLSTNVDIELWQTPIHFLVAALVLHAHRSLTETGNVKTRHGKETNWKGQEKSEEQATPAYIDYIL